MVMKLGKLIFQTKCCASAGPVCALENIGPAKIKIAFLMPQLEPKALE